LNVATDKSNVTAEREDISRFLIHLTRDDRASWGSGGGTAYDNLLAILTQAKVDAFRPHCLHNKRLDELSLIDQERFFVSCFTEVPLTQIHLLTQEVKGRRFRFEPYGVVFRKASLIEKGAQPALYINQHGSNLALREAADELFDDSVKSAFVGKAWKMLPYLNVMHSGYDFSWEREWRVLGSLKLTRKNVVALILPEGDQSDLKVFSAKYGIPVLSPGWTYDRIVEEFASQQRHTARLAGSGARTVKTTPRDPEPQPDASSSAEPAGASATAAGASDAES
jgi:hypothetical protein